MGFTCRKSDAELIRAVIDATPDALVVTRPDGNIVFVNASCEARFGYARAELISQPIELLVPDCREQELERLRSEWSSIVAHDLRQPLNAIGLHVGVLKRALARAPGGPIPDALHAAETISRSMARLNRMIDDLLDLSRLEARRLVLARCPTDLAALVRSVAEPLASSENAQPIHVHVKSSIPPVNVDPDRIAQVMENPVSGRRSVSRSRSMSRVAARRPSPIASRRSSPGHRHAG